MHDIKFIRENPANFDESLRKRGLESRSRSLIEQDEKIREDLTLLQGMQNKRNELAKQVGLLKRSAQDASRLIEEAESLKDGIYELENRVEERKRLLDLELSQLPNILLQDVHYGVGEDENQQVKMVGAPRSFDFTIKSHFELGEDLGLLDFEKAAQISGARFVIMKSQLARLERALINFMLDHNTKEHGYVEISPPQLVRSSSVYGVGQLPKFEDDLFKTTDGYYLISTAEVPLTNLVRGEIIPQEKLPFRFTAHTQCYRSEAGSAGKDTRGMIRLHQFSKVEMVSVVSPEESENEHQRMLSVAESMLQKLGLPYRIMKLCSGDTGFAAAKTYDIEVWLPGQDQYREISSCSNCLDFQARRINARYKEFRGSKNHFVHTLNGSGLPIGRTIVAIMENYQNQDGTVRVPEILINYMNGLEIIDGRSSDV
jgi:seryl-tRNA synthetase